MKILNVNHLLDPITGGGTAERTFQMSRFLAQAGAVCSILTFNIGLSQERMKPLTGIEILAVPCLFKRFYIPQGAFVEMWKMVKDADIIHLMGHWTLLNAVIYFFARCLKKPYVICPAGALHIFGRSKVLKVIYNFVIGKKILQNANGYIAITKDEAAQFESHGIDKNKIAIIPNGIDSRQYTCCDDLAFREKYGLGHKPFILFLGRLNLIKGPDLLLSAFALSRAAFPDIQLVFAGPDGGMLEELKKTSIAFNISEQIHFIGFIGDKVKSQAYHAAELLVIPSRSEAMSIVALEAGVSGTPVLLTNQCGFDEISNVAGGAVVAATSAGLQEGLIRMLKDRSCLKTMGDNLKRYTYENYLWDSIALKYLTFYKKIL